MYEAEKREIKDEVRRNLVYIVAIILFLNEDIYNSFHFPLHRKDSLVVVAGVPQAVFLLQEMWSVNGLSCRCCWTRF